MKGLKALRLAAGIKQKELAERLGVTQAALAHWESGDRNPGLEYITKCREIFNCTYDELIAGPDPADIISDKEDAVHG
mgnify:FL=1